MTNSLIERSGLHLRMQKLVNRLFPVGVTRAKVRFLRKSERDDLDVRYIAQDESGVAAWFQSHR